MIIYNNDLLQQVIIRDKCVVLHIPSHLIRRARIIFKCKCGLENEKQFNTVYISGAYCKECTKKNKIFKMQNTCQQRYGVSHATQTEECKAKYRKTCQEKYGTNSIMESSINIKK